MMTKLRHKVIIRATRKIKPKSLLHKLYLKCLHFQEDIAKAIDLILTDNYEERDQGYINLEHTIELTEEELRTFRKDFKKHLGVHLTKDKSEYIEKWTI